MVAFLEHRAGQWTWLGGGEFRVDRRLVEGFVWGVDGLELEHGGFGDVASFAGLPFGGFPVDGTAGLVAK